jgi:COMPASS component SWD3
MSELQPSNTDAILGGQNRLTTDTVILGGIEGIEQRLTSQDEEIQISALRAALKYDDKGLELLIDIWRNDSHELKWKAFSLLRTREEERVKQALSEYNPWLNMSCIHTWEQDSIAILFAIEMEL